MPNPIYSKESPPFSVLNACSYLHPNFPGDVLWLADSSTFRVWLRQYSYAMLRYYYEWCTCIGTVFMSTVVVLLWENTAHTYIIETIKYRFLPLYFTRCKKEWPRNEAVVDFDRHKSGQQKKPPKHHKYSLYQLAKTRPKNWVCEQRAGL